MDDSKSFDDELMSAFCQVFESGSFLDMLCAFCSILAAASHFSKQTSPCIEHSKSELEWFSRNSYNFAVRHGFDLRPEHLMRLATSGCEVILLTADVKATLMFKFINILHQVSDLTESEHIRSHQILCEFLTLIGSIVLARAADGLESSVVLSQVWPDARTDRRRCTIITSVDANRSVSKISFRHLCLRPVFP
jgi:hypothetical protein